MKLRTATILFLLPLLLLLNSCEEEKGKEDEKVILPLVKIETVQEKVFKHNIRVQGNVETTKDVLVTAEMGGQITSLKVKTGQFIRKGSLIATIDASVLASNIEELDAQLDYANYMLEKQVELNKRGVGSEFELETAKNNVKSLESRRKSVATQKGKAKIIAPFSGIVDQVFGKQGQMAGPSSPIIRLVNNDEVDIVATISEKHIMNVQVGTPLKITFPNYKDTAIFLSVTSIGNYIEPINRTFRIMSTIKDNKLLLPNMLAEIEVTDLVVNNGIVIPTRSVLKDQDNNDYVFIALKDKNQYTVKKVQVTIIQKYEGECLIESDLKKGQLIITEGARGITEGDIVRSK